MGVLLACTWLLSQYSKTQLIVCDQSCTLTTLDPNPSVHLGSSHHASHVAKKSLTWDRREMAAGLSFLTPVKSLALYNGGGPHPVSTTYMSTVRLTL